MIELAVVAIGSTAAAAAFFAAGTVTLAERLVADLRSVAARLADPALDDADKERLARQASLATLRALASVLLRLLLVLAAGAAVAALAILAGFTSQEAIGQAAWSPGGVAVSCAAFAAVAMVRR